MNQMKMNKLKKFAVRKFERRINSDFGWINFLSGIMLSSSINTLTGFCSSKDASVFGFLVSVCSGLSSGFFFALYQSLNKVKNEVENEIAMYGSVLTSNDLYVHRIVIWKKCISKEINNILVKIMCACISGILGLIGLIICYCDNNPDMISSLIKKINVLLETLYNIICSFIS